MTELTNEGYVQYVSGEVMSLQCFEGRHAECPDETPPEGPPDDEAGPLDHGWYCECGCKHGPAGEREPDKPGSTEPEGRIARLERTVELLNAYGTTKFGDEWWPGNARNWLPDPEGRELEYLLDPGSAVLADQREIPAEPENRP
jgi:hypothetical protein